MEILSDQHTEKFVEHLFRQQSGKMSSVLIRIFGFQPLELIEDIIQETFLTALKQWGMKGVPDNPEAWLMLVAKNKIINELKRRKKVSRANDEAFTEQQQQHIDELFLDHEIEDSQLKIVVACCIPDLDPKTRIMFILKYVAGFGDKEISRALLMKPETIKKRVYRARKKLSKKEFRLDDITKNDITERLDPVLQVLYLMFNEGYKKTIGDDLLDEDLCFEAIRITKILTGDSVVDTGKVHALLSLMFFHVSRFPSRINNIGGLVDLRSQDRSLWNKELIDAGLLHLMFSRESNELSKYHLLSTILAIHSTAPAFEFTDWENIITCYDRLLTVEDSFPVRLNRVIAISWQSGAEEGLKELSGLKESIPEGYSLYFYAAKAEMFERLKNYQRARSYYEVARDFAIHSKDQEYLNSKISTCDTLNIHSN